jgi:hypothetical protein
VTGHDWLLLATGLLGGFIGGVTLCVFELRRVTKP